MEETGPNALEMAAEAHEEGAPAPAEALVSGLIVHWIDYLERKRHSKNLRRKNFALALVLKESSCLMRQSRITLLDVHGYLGCHRKL